MKRVNPLFVDSTKHAGDSVGTQVEVKGLLLRDGESVFCHIIDSTFQELELPLQDEDGVYSGKVWLSHQENFEYRLLVKKEKEIIYKSPLVKTKASYALVIDWDPERVEEPPKKKTQEKATFLDKPLVKEKLGGLISKWGL